MTKPRPRAPMRRRDYFNAAIIGFCLAALIAPNLMPVVILPQVSEVTRTAPGKLRAEVSGIKLRNCPPLKGTFVGWQRTPEGWQEVGFEWIDDLSPGSSNPPSWWWQNFGPARWYGLSPAAYATRITVQHSCGGRAPRVTVLGPFPIPPE